MDFYCINIVHSIEKLSAWRFNGVLEDNVLANVSLILIELVRNFSKLELPNKLL